MGRRKKTKRAESGMTEQRELLRQRPSIEIGRSGRGRSYRRRMRQRAIDRKRHIIRAYAKDGLPSFLEGGADPCGKVWEFMRSTDHRTLCSCGDCFGYWHVRSDGRLNKGKIHCSCWMCRFYPPTAADMRRLAGAEERLKEALTWGEMEMAFGALNVQLCRTRKEIAGGGAFRGSGSRGGSPKDLTHMDYADWVERMRETG